MRPVDKNLEAAKTILKNSFGIAAKSIDDVVTVSQEDVPPREREMFTPKELIVCADEEQGILFFGVKLDFIAKSKNKKKVLGRLAGLNQELPLGSLRMGENGEVHFITGICGGIESELPGTVLADTITTALNLADQAQEMLKETSPD